MTAVPNVFAGDPRLPIRSGKVHFAVGPPDGLTSNGWVFFVSKSGDAYLTCRDNAREVKLSLHRSGSWHFGFTEEAVARQPALVPPGRDRAWDVWREPAEIAPGVVPAFHVIFVTSELAVPPEMRSPRLWKGTIYIEAAPPGSGQVVVATIFVTDGDLDLTHESEPTVRLASLPVQGGRRAQLVVHHDPELDIQVVIAKMRGIALDKARRARTPIPPGAFAYFFGFRPGGSRFMVGARLYPGASSDSR